MTSPNVKITSKNFNYAVTDSNSDGELSWEDAIAYNDALNSGKAIIPTMQDIVTDITNKKAKAILFGENHDYPTVNVIFETAKRLKQLNKKPIIAIEGIERGFQQIVDEFLAKEITQKKFTTLMFKENERRYKLGYMADPADFYFRVNLIIQAKNEGIGVACIDVGIKNDPPYDKEKLAALTNDPVRDMAMYNNTKKILDNDPQAIALVWLGKLHAKERNANTRLGNLLTKQYGDDNVLSLNFHPVEEYTTSNKAVYRDVPPEPIKTFKAINTRELGEGSFDSYDYNIPFINWGYRTMSYGCDLNDHNNWVYERWDKELKDKIKK